MNAELLRRATDHAQGVLSVLTHHDLRLPTPCEGWDVGRVVLHLADVADGLIGLLETGELALPQPPRTDDAHPVAVLEERLAKLAQAFSAETDATRVDGAALAGAIELVTHGWDVGVARDPAHRIPEQLAEDVRALVSPVLRADARGENFAPPVALASGAPASDRLVAFLGRAPRR